MNSIRKLMAVLALAFVLSVSALAGDVQTPGGTGPPPPPPPQTTSTVQSLLDRLLAALRSLT